jgi:hypothetical protein
MADLAGVLPTRRFGETTRRDPWWVQAADPPSCTGELDIRIL